MNLPEVGSTCYIIDHSEEAFDTGGTHHLNPVATLWGVQVLGTSMAPGLDVYIERRVCVATTDPDMANMEGIPSWVHHSQIFPSEASAILEYNNVTRRMRQIATYATEDTENQIRRLQARIKRLAPIRALKPIEPPAVGATKTI